MIKSTRYCTLIVLIFILFSTLSYALPKKCKCDEDAIINRESSNAAWNQAIHEACAAIQNKDYDDAYIRLEQALKIGEDPYIEGLFKCVTAMKGKSSSDASAVVSEKEKEKENEKEKEKKGDNGKEITKESKSKVETQPKKIVAEELKSKELEQPVTKEAAEKETKIEAIASSDPDMPEIMTEDTPDKEEPRLFTNEELASFQEKGIIKVNTFKNYLNKIGNKSTTQSAGLDAINNALKLFYGNTFVQVSSTRHDAKPKYPTKTYLERVRALNYDKVEIEWADFQYTSNLRKAPDGNYYGYIKFRQRFKGIRDGKVIYEDITDKTIAVVLKSYDKAIEGETVENFDIFLGDMDVLQTMKN
jgi:hypothetical protein